MVTLRARNPQSQVQQPVSRTPTSANEPIVVRLPTPSASAVHPLRADMTESSRLNSKMADILTSSSIAAKSSGDSAKANPATLGASPLLPQEAQPQASLRTSMARRAIPRALALAMGRPTSSSNRREWRKVLSFARNYNVPMNRLAQAVQHFQSSPVDIQLMAAKTYVIASDAVIHHRLNPHVRRRFKNTILPRLENGDLKFQKTRLSPDTLGTYEPSANLYTDSELNLDRLLDRATAIHELVHFGQDIVRGPVSALASERAAYETDAEYILRSVGVIQKTPGGVRIDGSRWLEAVATDPAGSSRFELIAARYTLRNIQRDRPHLNDYGLINRILGVSPARSIADFPKRIAIQRLRAYIARTARSIDRTWALREERYSPGASTQNVGWDGVRRSRP